MSDAITTINLCSVEITPTNQILFKTKEEQESYFRNRITKTYSECRYQNRHATLRVKGYVEDIRNSNYGFYTNYYKGNIKTYYFWIVQRNFLANEVTELTIVLDTFQTWLFDLNFEPSFVERCHVSDDTVGKNTLEEDFALGDYMSIVKQGVGELQGEVCYFLATSDDADKVSCKFGKTYSGFKITCYRETQISDLTNKIYELCENGKADTIAFIFTYPYNLVSDIIGNNQTLYEYPVVEKTVNFLGGMNLVHKFTDASGEIYKPFNNKLLTYPYNLMKVRNCQGDEIILKFENFSNPSNIEFLLESVITMNPSFRLVPKNYCCRTESLSDSITSKGYGLCSWNNDNYANWFANNQHSISAQSENAVIRSNASRSVAMNNYRQNNKNLDANLGMGLLNNGVGAIGSGLSGNAFGVVGNGVGAINNLINKDVMKESLNTDLANANLMNDTDYSTTMNSLLASIEDAKVTPNTCKGDTSSCGLDLSSDTATFFIERLAIKPEYARKIDAYFQMYGYKVNEVMDINKAIKTRTRWNYIKTLNCNVIGNIPCEDKDEIARLFDNGITLWHNISYMYNYNVKNDIREEN